MLDLAIIVLYIVGVLAAGLWFSRRQQTTERYFLAGRNLPWWAVSASIVATETSTISFISVPGIVYAHAGNFTFLQLVFGYLVGRVVIVVLFIPAFFESELVTVYELLQSGFGRGVRAFAASTFAVMRTVADSVRILLTAIVIAAVYQSFAPDASSSTAILLSILLVSGVMIVFTFLGGIEAVVWVEVVQLAIYVGGAVAAAAVLAGKIPGGIPAAIDLGAAHGKFRLFDFGLDLTRSYGFWAGLVGGCFLTMSTHGTDQFMVQRYLATRDRRSAAIGLLSSGLIVLVQFIGFLFIGVLLFAFYRPDRLPEYATSVAAPFSAPDQVFPHFIANHLPPGLMGIVVAAILAAAMSSSLNAIAATVTSDLYRPWVSNRPDKHYLNVSRLLTIGVGLLQAGIAVAFMNETRSALNVALGVASLLNGPILGLFLLRAAHRRDGRAALAGMTVGLATVTYVWLATPVAWPWYVAIGSLTTLLVGWALSNRQQ